MTTASLAFTPAFSAPLPVRLPTLPEGVLLAAFVFGRALRWLAFSAGFAALLYALLVLPLLLG